MFRLGLKKEEKEMINNTISEIKELRTELSGLRDALARMTAAESAEPAAVRPEEGGSSVAGLVPAGPTGGLGGSPDEGPGDRNSPPRGAVAPEGAGPAGSGDDQGGNISVDGNVDGGLPDGSQGGAGDISAAVGGLPDQPVAVRRDWAVVRLKPVKKPWWMFWKPSDRVTKRSI